MKKVFMLYNPLAGSFNGEENLKSGMHESEREIVYKDITKITDYKEFFDSTEEGDVAVISGGDGTLSRFATEVSDIEGKCPIYYYAAGSGNDFLNDLNLKKGAEPFLLSKYIDNLPVISVKGCEHRFINGVGGGLDAYACSEGNRLHSEGKKGNYVLSAVKGILYDYKPTKIKATVDGKEYEFENVWFASVMKGRFFGGGIMLAPNQDRKGETVSMVVVHKVGKLKLLSIIPSAFKGKHVKYKEYVEIVTGKQISVTFDKAVALQIDGETMDNIKEFEVKECVKVTN